MDALVIHDLDAEFGLFTDPDAPQPGAPPPSLPARCPSEYCTLKRSFTAPASPHAYGSPVLQKEKNVGPGCSRVLCEWR